MPGWLSRASACASRSKRPLEVGCAASSGARNFTATMRSEPQVARLPDGAHAAAPDLLQQLERVAERARAGARPRAGSAGRAPSRPPGRRAPQRGQVASPLTRRGRARGRAHLALAVGVVVDGGRDLLAQDLAEARAGAVQGGLELRHASCPQAARRLRVGRGLVQARRSAGTTSARPLRRPVLVFARAAARARAP